MKISPRTALLVLLLTTSAAATTRAQPTWERLGGPLIGPVADLHVTPNGLVYAAGLSDDVLFPNVYVSFDGGRSWEETPLAATDGSAAFASSKAGDVLYAAAYRVGGEYDGYAIVARGKQVLASQALVPAPYDAAAVGDTFFVATAQGVLCSHDGLSWQGAGLNGPSVYALVATEAEGRGDASSTRLLASTNEGLFASDDGAHTWMLLPGAPRAVYLMEALGSHVLAASDSGLWLSWDAGTTWASLGAPPFGEVRTVGFHSGAPVAGAGAVVWGYAADQTAWAKQATFPSHVLSLASTQDTLLVGTAGGVYRGTFGGGFRLTGLPQAAIAHLAAGQHGRLAALPTGYDLRVSSDDGAAWALRPTGSAVTALAYDDAGGLYVGTTSRGLLYLAPGDSVWHEAGFSNASIGGVRAGREAQLIVLTSDHLFVRTGAEWEQLASTGPLLSYAVARSPSGWLYVGGSGGMERMWIDGSQQIQLTFSGCSGCQVVDIEASSGFVFVVADAQLYRCGHTSTTCDRVGTWNAYVFEVAVAADGTVAVSLEHGGGVYASHDEGATWEDLSDGLPLFTGLDGRLPRSMGPVTFDAEGHLLVSVGETGLHRTQRPIALDVVSEHLVSAEGHTVSVYPNPACGAGVRLRWSRSIQGPVRYTLFDLLGRRIAGGTLLGEDEVPIGDLPPGFYVLRVDERDGAAALARFMVH